MPLVVGRAYAVERFAYNANAQLLYGIVSRDMYEPERKAWDFVSISCKPAKDASGHVIGRNVLRPRRGFVEMLAGPGMQRSYVHDAEPHSHHGLEWVATIGA